MESAKGYIEDTLKRRIVFFTGKGGVGKTTLTWATALACARLGRRVTVASWRPVGSDAEAPPFASEGIASVHLETLSAFREYTLQLIKFDTLYNAVFDNHVLRTFVMVAPGLSETVIAGKVWDLYGHERRDLVLVDLPASGHAISFFNSPIGVRKMFPVGFVSRETDKILAMFTAPETRIDLVALPEELPLVECRELKAQLDKLHRFHFGFLHLNNCLPKLKVPSETELSKTAPEVKEAVERFRNRLAAETEANGLADEIGLPQVHVPRFPTEALRESISKVSEFLEKA